LFQTNFAFDAPGNVPKILRVIKETAACGEEVKVQGKKQQIINSSDGDLGEFIAKNKDESSVVAIRCKQCELVFM